MPKGKQNGKGDKALAKSPRKAGKGAKRKMDPLGNQSKQKSSRSDFDHRMDSEGRESSERSRRLERRNVEQQGTDYEESGPDLDIVMSVSDSRVREDFPDVQENQTSEDEMSEEEEIDREEYSSQEDQNNNSTREIDYQVDEAGSSASSGVVKFRKTLTRETKGESVESEEQFMEKLAIYMEKRAERKEMEKAQNEQRRNDLGERRIQVPSGSCDSCPATVINKNKPRDKAQGDKGQGRRISQGMGVSISDSTIYTAAVPVISNEDNVREGFNHTTFQHNVVPNQFIQKRHSSSSEEAVDTSDELIEPPAMATLPFDLNIADEQQQPRSLVDRGRETQRESYHRNDRLSSQPQPHSSRDPEPSQPEHMTPEDKARQLIKQAEKAKARILEVPGKVEEFLSFDKLHSVLVDEEYSALSTHVDDLLKRKIIAGDYIDFAKLLPTDRTSDEDQEMRMVNRGGFACYVPTSDREIISSFGKWEQAFRVFCNIYTEAYPLRAAELMQYSHIIHSASTTFIWSNVYAYDKDTRRHMAKFPSRSWGMILQQSWTFRLKDRVGSSSTGGGNQDVTSKYRRNVCYKYNRGKCTFGMSCKFEHRCVICLKFGHGSHNCRKAGASGGPRFGGSAGCHTGNNGGNNGNGSGGGRQESIRGDNNVSDKGGFNWDNNFRAGGGEQQKAKNDRFHFFKKDNNLDAITTGKNKT